MNKPIRVKIIFIVTNAQMLPKQQQSDSHFAIYYVAQMH